MRLLLDTHAFLWWAEDSPRLPQPARRAIQDEDNDVLVSAASAWEIATRHRLGKLPGAEPIASDIPGAIAAQGFVELPITVQEAARAGALPGPHRDPFDLYGIHRLRRPLQHAPRPRRSGGSCSLSPGRGLG